MEHRQFRELPRFLRPGDVLVLNNSRVIPARLRGINPQTGGRFEVLLLAEIAPNDWWAMLRPGRRARMGGSMVFLDRAGKASEVRATVVEVNEEGHRRLRFTGTPDVAGALDALGEVPLPPYIHRRKNGAEEEDRQRYQTVFAQPPGSVAAPTAGLHFTTALLEEIQSLGIKVRFVTLHVGLGTFAPVKAEVVSQHRIHEESYALSQETVRAVQEAKSSGGRVIAVGTTSMRVLESAVAPGPESEAPPAPDSKASLVAGPGRTRIFIYPPYRFQTVDALLTNFHLPRSTLLMLASAFASPGKTEGRNLVLSAYAEAVRERYRFFSYGDAMLIL
jgi:S-adenosylmethionine:tRNA ribosyltransferase-isomerase